MVAEEALIAVVEDLIVEVDADVVGEILEAEEVVLIATEIMMAVMVVDGVEWTPEEEWITEEWVVVCPEVEEWVAEAAMVTETPIMAGKYIILYYFLLIKFQFCFSVDNKFEIRKKNLRNFRCTRNNGSW